MEIKQHSRPTSSCGVLRNIKNLENRIQTFKPKPLPRPPKKSRELQHLEAELGVEKYKNILLTEEISQHKQELVRTKKFINNFEALKNDYELLTASVKRSKTIQEQQKEEIENLKRTVYLLRNCK